MNHNRFQHIVMVSLDSLRNDCLTVQSSAFPDQVLGPGKFRTTLLDEIARKGIYLRNCISAAPYTSASHAAYFTGCWPRHNGVYEFFNRKINVPTLFQLAKKAGFHTFFQTDFPIILGDSLGFTRGVDNYFIESEHTALNALIEKKDLKTLSFFHFGGIHYPYGFHKLQFAPVDYPKTLAELETRNRIAPRASQTDTLDESYRSAEETELLLRYKQVVDTLWQRHDFKQLHRLYLEGIDYFMRHRFNPFLNRLLDFIDHSNSLLILFADHGEHWAPDSRGHSNSIADEVLRVPVILYGNGLLPATVSHLVRTIDIAPTICHYSSIPASNFDGKTLNLFNPAAIDSNRIAIAQVWRVGDREKIYNHQQKILQGKKMIKPLKTFLEKEAVYEKGFAMVREYSKKRLSKETLFKNTGLKLISCDRQPAPSKNLRGKLDRYNKVKGSTDSNIKKINLSIIKNLQTLGYNV